MAAPEAASRPEAADAELLAEDLRKCAARSEHLSATEAVAAAGIDSVCHTGTATFSSHNSLGIDRGKKWHFLKLGQII